MNAIIFDAETTGTTEPQIVEACWIRLTDIASLEVDEMFVRRYQPSKPIELGALATHHILDESLRDCPPSSEFRLPDGTEYVIGHNVDFDWQAIGCPAVKRICTLALSRHLWPDADSHSLSAMLYLLDRQTANERLMRGVHTAEVDVGNCHYLLGQILLELGARQLPQVTTWNHLWQASEMARVPTVMPFGKHKGQLIRDIPMDYRQWLLRQPDVDPYLAKALQA